jgi:hypothetical protein
MLKITAAQIVAIDAYNAAHRKAVETFLSEAGECSLEAQRRSDEALAYANSLHPAFVAAGGQWLRIEPWMRRKLAAEIADELRAMAHDDAETFGREVAQ